MVAGSRTLQLAGQRVLLVIGGGIAAYKVLELIRRLKEQGATTVPVMTSAAQEFVTPLSVAALAAEDVHTDLFEPDQEARIGHITLSRAADIVLVAPATADLLAKMACGIADDLASTLLLATNKRILVAPAMNVRMWDHPATRRNIATLERDGVCIVGPDKGDMACGEFGPGRMSEPDDIVEAVTRFLFPGPLSGRHVIVTSGRTHEPIDPVRYIGNRSSGKQGTAIALALRDRGARVSFITGPADCTLPEGVSTTRIETARELRDAVLAALPAEAGVFVAAVGDWRVKNAHANKIKKDGSGQVPRLEFVENPDVLRTVAALEEGRPQLVIGFAAETRNLLENARAKRVHKGCDWIVANDVSRLAGNMGGPENEVTLVTGDTVESWRRMSKERVAGKLADRMAEFFSH